MHTLPHYPIPAPFDADLDALIRLAAATLAPHSRERFGWLVERGATATELAAVFGLPAVPAQAAA